MKKLLFCLQFILITSFTLADTTNLFTPSEYAIEAAKHGEDMSDEEFMYFAFAFSEIQEVKISTYMQEYRTLASKLETELKGKSLSDFEKGEYILSFLHNNLFNTYREPITNLNNLFDSGVYNCVSSSIVYYSLAMRLGLTVTGVKTIDHAFCSVVIDGEITDVETTSPFGFNPGEKKEFENSFGQTGFVYTPPSNYRDRTNIGKVAMLSLIMQNHIVELYKTQRFDTIVHLAVNIDTLLQTEGSREAMVREFGNYAAYLSKRQEYARGIDFFIDAQNHFGEYEQFNESAGALFNNGIATLLSYRSIHQLSQNIQQAQDFFNTYKNESVIPVEVIQSSEKILDEASIRVFIEENQFEISVDEVKQYYTGSKISEKIYNDLLMYLYSKEINIIMKTQDWSTALNLANNAIHDTINDSRAKTQLKTVEHNIATFYHNAFATEYNIQNFIRAKEILQAGLLIIPNNKTLQTDSTMLEKQIQ